MFFLSELFYLLYRLFHSCIIYIKSVLFKLLIIEKGRGFFFLLFFFTFIVYIIVFYNRNPYLGPDMTRGKKNNIAPTINVSMSGLL